MKYLFILIGSLLWVKPAYAYLDPGTGSIIMQSVIALIAGIAVAVKAYWSHIKAFLTRKKNVPCEEETGDSR